jgi:hypothetical protein
LAWDGSSLAYAADSGAGRRLVWDESISRPGETLLASRNDEMWTSARPQRLLGAGVRAGAVVTFVAVKVLHTALVSPVLTGDGRIWAHVARESLFSQKFWLGRRPFSLPLIYKLLGPSDDRIVWFQTGLAVIAWLLLAHVLAALVQSELVAVATVTLVLALGLTTPVNGWDVVIRSESIAISFLCLCIAGVVGFAQRAERARGRTLAAWSALAVANGVFAAFARETSAYLLPLLGAVALFGAWSARRGRARANETAIADGKLGERSATPGYSPLPASLVLVAGLVLSSIACQVNTRSSGRFAFPLVNVIFQRILPDAEKLRYFRDEAGLPVSQSLLGYRFKWASSDGRAAFSSPALADFRTWIHEQGYRAYERYLVAHASSTAREALTRYPWYVRDRFERLHPYTDNLVTDAADALLVTGPTATYPKLALLLAAGVGLLALFRSTHALRLLGGVSLFGATAALTQVYVCYHGDAMELERHGVMVGTLVRLTVIVACVLVADAARALRLARTGSASRCSGLASRPQPPARATDRA